MKRRACHLRSMWWATLLCVAEGACQAADPQQTARVEFFESRIRAVLVERCFECHGGGSVEGG